MLLKPILCRCKLTSETDDNAGLCVGISVRSEKALQREKDITGKESDRRKKRLKGNQIEIPSRRYRGCSRYGVYKWKAMNRWIRGKEIKAEAEWTARWVFRYDKSPRKSPFFLFIPFFSVFSAPCLIPHPHSLSLCHSPLLFLSCRLLTLFVPFFFLFFRLTVLAEEVARLFESRIDTPMRGSDQSRARTAPLTHEFLFNSHRDAILSLRSESHDSRIFRDIPATNRISPACRFKLAVKIADFNILKELHRTLAPISCV